MGVAAAWVLVAQTNSVHTHCIFLLPQTAPSHVFGYKMLPCRYCSLHIFTLLAKELDVVGIEQNVDFMRFLAVCASKCYKTRVKDILYHNPKICPLCWVCITTIFAVNKEFASQHRRTNHDKICYRFFTL